MIIYGKQTCLYVLERHSNLIDEIYFGKEIARDLFAKFSKLNKPILRLDSKKMQALSKGGNHQGFILKVNFVESSFKNFKSLSRILVLVGISDVGNIGSIFRSSYALGVDLIISSNPFSLSGVARASSGAFFDMPYIIYKDILSLSNELKLSGFSLIGSAAGGEAKNITSTKWALFLGSEGEGLSKRLLGKMDNIIGVKMRNFNSLNVSVAAGILINRMVENEMY